MPEFNKMVKLVTRILPCLVIILVAENASLNGCPKSEVTCLCGERPNAEVRMFEIQPELFYDESKDCQQLSSEVCASHSCLFSSSGASDFEIDLQKHSLRDYSFHPVKVSFPPLADDAEESRRMLRDRRAAQKCLIPQVEHAAMSCSVWGEFYTCEIKCNPGYAFEEDGKMMQEAKRACVESKPVWRPKNTFPVCKAYINCKAVLVKPGTLECIPGPGIPYCDISCKMDYENGNGEVPLERFECVNEHFADTLPHCATMEKNMDMLKLSKNHEKSAPKTG